MSNPFERLANPVKCHEDDIRPKCIWCAFYEVICLPRAAQKNWENFHCEACIMKRDTPWPAMMWEARQLREKKNAGAKLSSDLSQNV